MRTLGWVVLCGITACGGSADSDALLVVSISADRIEGRLPLTVQLDAVVSSGAASDFTWDLAGVTADGASVEHTFLASGLHTVALVATDAAGALAQAAVEIEVGQARCPGTSAPTEPGFVDAPALIEVSGLVASRDNPGVLWVHNDAGDGPYLYALDEDGTLLGRWEVDGAEPRDWEDLAIGSDPETGAGVLYIGDIGDNAESRDSIQVFRVPEPRIGGPGDGVTEAAATLTLTYPERAYDAETLLLDPVTDDLVVVTKSYEGDTRVFRKAAPHADGDVEELILVAELDFDSAPLSGGATTGGDISPLGDAIVIRTYRSEAYLWRRDQAVPLADAFTDQRPCAIALPSEGQGESIGFGADGAGLWSISEGGNIPVNYTPHRWK
ncbi:MAG: hypothetical protein ACI9K2_005060 [Myxococcota bacterium]|jgi:hypothetical protein